MILSYSNIMSSFKVTIGNITINDGMILPFDMTQQKPKITFDKNQGDKFIILVVDPDAPTRKNPIYKYWLHLLIINNNDTIVDYEFPSPPAGSGKHQYVFYLLKQEQILNRANLNVDKNIKRNNFNVAEFMNHNKLKIVDSVYFETERK